MIKSKKRIYALIIVLLLFLRPITAYAETIVYITNTGECYHIEGCSYLKSSIPISLEDAKARGYRACSRCKPDENLGERYKPKSNASENKAKSGPKEEVTPKPTAAPKVVEAKQETKNDGGFWENAFYFAIGGGVVYGISKKSKKE